MTPPPTIPRSAIDFSDRGRTIYNGIESLAESIEQNGLIQPIVLEPLQYYGVGQGCEYLPQFKLSAGGRRLTALDLLGVTEFHHGVTSMPGRYGYVLKGVDESTPLKSLLTEIAENLDRDDLDWRDEARLIVRAYRLAKAEANAIGETLVMRDFGAMLGCGYMDVRAAVAIMDDLNANPERYEKCGSMRGALAIKLEVEKAALNAELARRAKTAPAYSERVVPSSDDPQSVTLEIAESVVNLSANFHHTNGVEYLAQLPSGTIDHIITDPDYGVSVERLEASVRSAASGVAQESIEQTLQEFDAFFAAAFRALSDHGFLVFFYDLDHHEKLLSRASSHGFRVQRWPLIWHKTDYRSNASPHSNFCKNVEYAMVCRKPGATLQAIQMSSIFACGSEGITKELGHPFAKPRELWKFIFRAVTVPGQVVFDPFVGSGSMPIAAIEHGLRPMGCEIQPQHFHQGLENIKQAYEKKLGKVQFV